MNAFCLINYIFANIGNIEYAKKIDAYNYCI